MNDSVHKVELFNRDTYFEVVISFRSGIKNKMCMYMFPHHSIMSNVHFDERSTKLHLHDTKLICEKINNAVLSNFIMCEVSRETKQRIYDELSEYIAIMNAKQQFIEE